MTKFRELRNGEMFESDGEIFLALALQNPMRKIGDLGGPLFHAVNMETGELAFPQSCLNQKVVPLSKTAFNWRGGGNEIPPDVLRPGNCFQLVGNGEEIYLRIKSPAYRIGTKEQYFAVRISDGIACFLGGIKVMVEKEEKVPSVVILR